MNMQGKQCNLIKTGPAGISPHQATNRYKSMNKIEKEKIREALATYCEHKGSQNKAANSLKGVSSAVISKVLNNEWDLIADEMWRKIATQICYSSEEWVVVETRDFQLMTMFLQDAQRYSNVVAVVGDAGSGKSLAIREYSNANK